MLGMSAMFLPLVKPEATNFVSSALARFVKTSKLANQNRLKTLFRFVALYKGGDNLLPNWRESESKFMKYTYSKSPSPFPCTISVVLSLAIPSP